MENNLSTNMEVLTAYLDEAPVGVLIESGAGGGEVGTPTARWEVEYDSWPTPEAEVHRWYLDDGGLLSDEERQRHYQLMTRELGQPGEAFDLVVEEIMRRHTSELGSLLQSIAPEGIDKESLTLKIVSINALVHYFNFARLAISRLTGREYDAAFKARLVEHITEFSLHGLGVAKTEKPR